MMTSRTASVAMVVRSPPRLLAYRQQQHAGARKYSAEEEPGRPHPARQVDVDEAEDAQRGQDPDGPDEEDDEHPGDDESDQALGGDDRLVPHHDHGVFDLVGYLISPVRHSGRAYMPFSRPH